MIKRIAACILFAALSAIALAKADPDKEKLKAEVAAMEDAFCAMAREKGLLAAFSYFAPPDVAFIDTDPRNFRGPAALLHRLPPAHPAPSLPPTPSHTPLP